MQEVRGLLRAAVPALLCPRTFTHAAAVPNACGTVSGPQEQATLSGTHKLLGWDELHLHPQLPLLQDLGGPVVMAYSLPCMVCQGQVKLLALAIQQGGGRDGSHAQELSTNDIRILE
jgi:hypothetical protein